MKITKSPRKLAEATPQVSNLLRKILAVSDDQLPDVLDDVLEWCWPRGDLHYWTQTLNRFDVILADTIKEYGISTIQVKPFEPHRKRLVASILRFSRLLIENCTNRKLYNSYDRLNELLMTQDLDVLEATLRLLLRPAQQYSSQGGGRTDLPISQARLATLALTWSPKEHGQDMATTIRPNAPITEDMLGLRFQFYRRADQSSSQAAPLSSTLGRTADAEAGPTRPLDTTPVRPSPSSRREGRPTPHASASAAGGLSLSQHGESTQPAGTSDRSENRDLHRTEGLTTVRIKNVLASGKLPAEIFTDVVQEHGVPEEDRFNLFQQIRVAASLPDAKARRQLLISRLFALACYCHLAAETVANTQLFLYEPDVVQKTAAFVEAMTREDQVAQAAGLYALDGLGRFRSKLSDVLSSVSASVNHGTLLRTLRLAIEDLASETVEVSELLIDSIFGLIAFITSTQLGNSMIVGAGLIPLLVQLVETCKSKAYLTQRTVSRAIGLVDSILHTNPPSFQWFVEVRGLEVCVNRIQAEIAADLQDADAQMTEDSLTSTDADPLYGKLTFGRASLLRNLLKSITHMMQSTGTTEGLRGLIDSSLLESIILIFKSRQVFGPQILALAINIVATFIHNEPTSLTILQEKKVPELFFDLVETDIESNSDVISAIPNAIGAICLNEAGLNLFNSRSDKVIPKMFSVFTSKRHLAILQDRDTAALFGSAIDELIRHQPSMKQTVLNSVLSVFDEINHIGESFQPGASPDSDARVCLNLVSKEANDSLSGHEEGIPVRSLALGDVVINEVSGHRRAEQGSNAQQSDMMGFMDAMARFLDGFFQSAPQCKEFLKSDGPDKLLKFLSLPCLPYNFPSSMTADSLVSLLRYMAEVSPGAVVGALLKEIKKEVVETQSLWSTDTSKSSLAPLLDPSNDADLTKANKGYHNLISLNAKIYLLANVLPTFSYSGQKTPAAFLQTLQNSVNSPYLKQATISELGDLLRRVSWENLLLKATAPPTPKKETKIAESMLGTQAGVPEDVLEDNAGTVERQETSVNIEVIHDKDADPRLRNSVALRYLMLQLPNSLMSFFGETARLLIPRRTPDPTARKLAMQAAASIGESLARQLQWQESSNLSNSFAFATVMIGHVTNLLFDDRSLSTVSHTAILLPFELAGGVNTALDLYNRYIADFDKNQEQSPLEAIEAKLRLGHICGGLKVALNMFQNLSAAQVLLEAPATTSMANKEVADGKNIFKPHELLLRLRLAILPPIRDTWHRVWLHKLPLSINRSVLQTLLHILQGEGESPPKEHKPESSAGAADSSINSRPLAGSVDAFLNGFSNMHGGVSSLPTLFPPSGSTSATRRANFTADESRIQQIVDMGFPRRAARHALTRYSNNTNAATEYLLAHPEVVGSMANEPDEPPAPEPEAATQTAAQNAEANGQQASSADEVAPAEPSSNTTDEGTQTTSAAQQSDRRLSTSPSATATAEGSTAATHADGDVAMQETNVPGGTPTKSTEADRKSDTPEASPLKEELDVQRKDLAGDVTVRGLQLADHHDALVFDVKDSIVIYAHDADQTAQKLKALIEDIHSLATTGNVTAIEVENKIGIRLHLLALVLNEDIIFRNFGDELSRMAFNSIGGLASGYDHLGAREKHAKWLAPLFLVASSILSRQEEPRDLPAPKEDSPITPSSLPVKQSNFLEAEAHAFFSLCLRCLSTSAKLVHEDFLALYRLLVLLTRNPHMAKSLLQRDGIQVLLRPFLERSKLAQGCQVYVVIILRHVVEAQGLLRTLMSQQVRAWFAESRTPSVDVGSLLRGLSQVALRDPDTFLDIMKDDAEMTEFVTSKGSCLVRLVTKEQQPEDKDGAGLADETFDGPPSPTKGGQPLDAAMSDLTKRASGQDAQSSQQQQSEAESRSDVDGVVHFLLSELLSTSRERTSLVAQRKNKSTDATAEDSSQKAEKTREEAAANGNYDQSSGEGSQQPQEPKPESAEDQALDSTYFYMCFVMQCLTELTSSYATCKTSFTNCNKKRLASFATGKDLVNTPKAKGVPGVMNLFLTELVPMGFVDRPEDAIEARRRATISNCAMSTIVAMCSDVCFHQSIKDVAPELLSTRKQMLDFLVKSLKDSISSSEVIEARYGRLYALADLCHRLLTAKPVSPTSNTQSDDLTLHIAKTMLEKNFVPVLTVALADVDLNLPTVKTLLDAILRPLDHLTRVAIKAQSKAGHGEQAVASDTSDSEAESLSEEEATLDEGREETPDFYRSSALGMHTGEMGDADDSMGEEDDEMEDDEMGEMEYSDDEDRSDLSDESDDDEDDDEDEDMDDSLGDPLDDADVEELDDSDEADELEAMNGQDDEDGWVDEDSEDDIDDSDGSDGGLDFIIGESEDLPGADEGAFAIEGMDEEDEGNALDHLDIVADEAGGEYETDEDTDFDEEGMGMLAYPNAGPNPHDRFGANWSWAQPQAEAANGRSGQNSLPLTLPPTFFQMNAAGARDSEAAGGSRRYDLQPSGLAALPDEDPASHPLLVDEQRDEQPSQQIGRRSRRGAPGGFQDWAHSLHDIVGESAIGFFEAIFGQVAGGDAAQGPAGGLGIGPHGGQGMPRMQIGGISATDGHSNPLGGIAIRNFGRSHRQGHRQERDRRQNQQQTTDPVAAVRAFNPVLTVSRLRDEERIVFGELASDRVARLRNHLTSVLLPKYQAKANVKKDHQAELAKVTGDREHILQELNSMRARLLQHESEVNDLRSVFNQAHQRAQQAELQQTSASNQTGEQAAEVPPTRSGEDIEMSEGGNSNAAPPSQAHIELNSLQRGLQELDRGSNSQSDAAAQQSSESGQAPAESSADPQAASNPGNERDVISVNGRDVDITDLGIDREVLAALPEEMQEEVIGQALRDRGVGSVVDEEETSISPEFLNALPPELRAEVLQQEAAERAERRRGNQENENEANSTTADAADRDGAPTAGAQDSGNEAQPQAQSENQPRSGVNDSAGDFGGDLRRHIANMASHRRFDANGVRGSGGAQGTDKGPQRDSIQLLDSNGIAAIVRLLYFPGLDSSKKSLHKVLANLAKNAKTRADILNMLLKILADGSVDSQAVDKSFANMSARAQSSTPGRTPTLKRTLSTGGLNAQGSAIPPSAPLARAGEEAPHLIASRSIETLLFLTGNSTQCAQYFLHEDARHSKKAKGKERERGMAPINTLLGLLDKPYILSNAQVTYSLIALLSTVTKHIATVTAQAEAEQAKKKEAESKEQGEGDGQAEDSHKEGTQQEAVEKPFHVSKEHLAAVVRPLGTAISSKGFQNTLAVAAHLAAIDGESKNAVTSALQNEAIAATAILSQDLDGLLATLPIVQAEEEEEEQQPNGEQQTQNPTPVINPRPQIPKDPAKSRIQSSALPILASPSSAQARLLRSLRAIEWLHGGR
ncbi:unnamed protein product [Sympodiomycopsis kandeliae]